MPATRLFQPGDEAAFRDLNVAWIEKYFGVEAEDLSQLEDVERAILAKGGRVIFVEHEGAVCGTSALVPVEPGLVEFAKMAVRHDVQGLGLGKALMTRAIEEARDMGAEALWFESNTMLAPAIGLYRAFGFEELPKQAWRPTPYARCNIQLLKSF